MRGQGPKVIEVSWLVRIGPNFFFRKPASHLRALDRKFKVSGILPTLGRRNRIRMQAGNRSGKSSLDC